MDYAVITDTGVVLEVIMAGPDDERPGHFLIRVPENLRGKMQRGSHTYDFLSGLFVSPGLNRVDF